MTWENLRPKILARHDFSGYVGEASWDSFKSPESPTASLSRSQSNSSDMVGLARPHLGLAMCKNSGFEASPRLRLAQASPCIKQ